MRFYVDFVCEFLDLDEKILDTNNDVCMGSIKKVC